MRRLGGPRQLGVGSFRGIGGAVAAYSPLSEPGIINAIDPTVLADGVVTTISDRVFGDVYTATGTVTKETASGLQRLTGDGVSGRITCLAAAIGARLTGKASATVFLGAVDTTAATSAVMYYGPNITTTAGFNLIANGVAVPDLDCAVRAGGSTGFGERNNNTINLATTPRVLTFYVRPDLATGSLVIGVDGVDVALADIGSANVPGVLDSQALSFFARVDGAIPWAGSLYYVAIFDGVPAAAVKSRVVTFIGARCGVVL